MPRETLPYHKEFPRDFLAEVFGLALPDIGAYAVLRAVCWLETTVPLEQISRKYGVSPKTWERISHLFEVTPEGIIHPGLERERAAAKQEKDGKTERARRGAEEMWRRRRGQRESNASAVLEHCSGDAQASGEQCLSVPSQTSDIRRQKEEPPPTPSSPETVADLETWAETIYARHPKKGHRMPALRALSEVDGIESAETRAAIDEAHQRWCGSEEWTWKSGAKAPFLDQWVVDCGWKYLPPGAESRPAGRSDPLTTDPLLTCGWCGLETYTTASGVCANCRAPRASNAPTPPPDQARQQAEA
jgi:uncharacterized protein YdaU (DUF1376 family)